MSPEQKALKEYGDMLDNLAKVARYECDQVRAGQPWDEYGYTRAVLTDAVRTFDRLVRAYDKATAATGAMSSD